MPKLREIPCIRMTPDGAITVEFRCEGKEVEYWVEYNQRNRKNCVLVVNEQIRHPGIFETEVAAAAAIKLKWRPLCPR